MKPQIFIIDHDDGSSVNVTAARGLLKEGEDAEKVTEADWRKRLTDMQYYVCREHGTERVSITKIFYEL